MADIRTYNVVVLGIGFLFIFTAFTTCGNIEVSYLAFILHDINYSLRCMILQRHAVLKLFLYGNFNSKM